MVDAQGIYRTALLLSKHRRATAGTSLLVAQPATDALLMEPMAACEGLFASVPIEIFKADGTALPVITTAEDLVQQPAHKIQAEANHNAHVATENERRGVLNQIKSCKHSKLQN